MIFLVLLGFACIVAIELPVLIKAQYRRELVVFTILTGAAFILSILLALGVKLPYIELVLIETFTKLGLTIK
ncbi:MAG: hypothetical protein GX050_00680 [Firmicutes bacterium]|nr:hypothetical protein [Bacillota bacterium]